MKKLFNLAESENIKVVEEYLPGKLKGFYYRDGKDMMICLEKRLNKLHKRIIFAEELGHHFTSFGDTFDLSRPDFNTCSRSEYRARKWAAEFLIPNYLMAHIIEKNKEQQLPINQITEMLDVTPEFLEFRFNVFINR